MGEILEFMRWPLLACLLLPPILIYLGLHIIRREIIFVDLALAQVAALGACFAVLLGHHDDLPSYAWSLAFTLGGAGVFTLTRSQKPVVPQEALIGIIYVVAAAGGILLLSRSAEGDEELRRTLVGDVLLVNRSAVLRTAGLYALIGIIHFLFRKNFIALSFGGPAAGSLAVRRWDFLFYCLFGIVVTNFVQIGGVLLTFSYLIIPAACASYLGTSLQSRLLFGWSIAAVSSMVALYLSYRFDLPTGAAIVCVLGASLLMIMVISAIRRRS